MNKKLSSMKCEACEGLGDRLTTSKIQENMKHLKDWLVINNHHLEKTFKFKDFKEALQFVNTIGVLAEKEGHHPNIDFTWGEVTVKLWTHNLHGLTLNDFIMAAKIDELKR